MKFVGLKIAVNEIIVGDSVAFSYNGKNRIGVVEKRFDNAVCVKLPSGAYKTFTLAKIRPTIIQPVDADYERRMNIIDNGR